LASATQEWTDPTIPRSMKKQSRSCLADGDLRQ
jgi:hypothetical protein